MKVAFDKEKFLTWAKSYSEYESIKERAKVAFSDWSLGTNITAFDKMRLVCGILIDVTYLVEKFCRDIDDLESKEKLNAAAEFIDEIVQFPQFVEWFDKKAILYLLSMLVEAKNNFLGKNWFAIETMIKNK